MHRPRESSRVTFTSVAGIVSSLLFGGGEDSAAWTADAIRLAHTHRYGFADGVSGVKAGGNGSPRLATAARVVMNTHSSPSFSPTK